MRRGLFGSKTPSAVMNPMLMAQMAGEAVSGATMPQAMPQMQPTQQQRPGLGTRLLGEGWEQRAVALGGALMGDRNAISRYHAGQQQQDMLRQQQAAELAAEQREIAQGRDDYAWRRQYDIANPAPSNAQPYRWETNNGSLAEIGPDGQPRIVYEDPTPRINWVRADNGDGTHTLVPMGPNGPMGGAPQQQGSAPPDTLPADFDFGGGTTSNSGGSFRR